LLKVEEVRLSQNPFNSLYEIPLSTNGNLISQASLSILSMRFTNSYLSIRGRTLIFFQFSLWDSWGCRRGVEDQRRLLSILSMRFSSCWKGWGRFWVCFQFSLWDSEQAVVARRHRLYGFQFSLWDSRWSWEHNGYNVRPFNSLYEIPIAVWSHLTTAAATFQFSLWDSVLS